jgi:hypothetical protein
MADALQILLAQMGQALTPDQMVQVQNMMRSMANTDRGGLSQDQVIRAPGQPHGSVDPGIVARPYTGPQTGDPVINPPSVGTFDRSRFLLTPELKYQIRNPPYTQMPAAFAPPTGAAPYQSTIEPIVPPTMMPSQDDYLRPPNLGFGSMGYY